MELLIDLQAEELMPIDTIGRVGFMDRNVSQW